MNIDRIITWAAICMILFLLSTKQSKKDYRELQELTTELREDFYEGEFRVHAFVYACDEVPEIGSTDWGVHLKEHCTLGASNVPGTLNIESKLRWIRK